MNTMWRNSALAIPGGLTLLVFGGLTLFYLLCPTTATAVVITVTTTDDNGNNITPTPGSLREAINTSNASPSADTIAFNFGAAMPPFVIKPPVDLPFITDSVIIDGYLGSPGGARPNTLMQGDDAIITVVINGSNYKVGDGIITGNGLHFAPLANTTVDNSIVRGLVINEWLDNGILLDTTNQNITNVAIIGNFIGTNEDATGQMANRCGVGIAGAGFNFPTGTLVGTPNTADRNIIAGSFAWYAEDVYNINGASIAVSDDFQTTIQNNYVGLDRHGKKILGNSQVGMLLDSTSFPVIGGAEDSERNVVAGHIVASIIGQFPFGATIQNNYVGTDVTGSEILDNGNAGIALFGTTLDIPNTVAKNLVVSHGVGVRVGAFSTPGCILNALEDNIVGTDGDGSKAFGNARYGMEINDDQNSIRRNHISGNKLGGLLIYGQANANNVSDNRIRRNDGNGIQVGLDGGFGGAFSNTIGSED